MSVADWLPEGPRPDASLNTLAMGVLLDLDETTNRARVSINGSPGSWLPYVPNVYDGITTVYVLVNPLLGGVAELVLGPCGTVDEEHEDLPTPPAPDPDDPDTPEDDQFRTVTTTIRPTWSGTYRAGSGWDRWNVGRYGGRSDLYQGTAPFSPFPTLTGLAVYGNQVTNLGAHEITQMRVRLQQNGSALGSYPAIHVQGSPHGTRPSGAPSTTGVTLVGPSLGRNQNAWMTLASASMREAFRTGAVKGLALVGSGYNAVRGTASAGAMALEITYRRRV